MYLLFPGRHLLNTKFQEKYLWDIFGDKDNPYAEIVFAVTSANQENSRYNPLPFHARALGLDRFANQYRKKLGVSYRIVPIPHFKPSPDFAKYVLKETQEYYEGALILSPENTAVLCSTPEVMEQFTKLGFKILTAEFNPSAKTYTTKTPIEVLKDVVGQGESWATNPEIQAELSEATKGVWVDFPEIPKKIMRIWRDPLLTETGSLTETRDYSTYAYGMGQDAVIEYKYNDMKTFILPGKIADEGCADGSLIVRLAKDFTDSDILGIEITSEFVARCRERQRAGEFSGTFVYIHQRNLMDKIFEDNSINTTICNSTTHEIWSYGDKEVSLKNYLNKKYHQTKMGGRIIIRDVVGPEDKNEIVYLWLNDKDGENQGELKNLSTRARFLRFANDFLEDMRQSQKRRLDSKIQFEEREIESKKYAVLRLKDAAEFMMKKDYVDNWRSELNEEFAFWSFSEWKSALSEAGFAVLENPNQPDESSRAYANPWIIENRLKNKVGLFKIVGEKLEALPYPVTNMVLVGEKLSR